MFERLFDKIAAPLGLPYINGTPTECLLRKLVAERQLTSHLEVQLAANLSDFVRNNENRIRVWIDPDNVRNSDCGRFQAFRSITMEGELLWFVKTFSKKFGYHSQHSDPFAAMIDAQLAWAERSHIKKTHWQEIETLAQELRLGTTSFDITISDAEKSPLCSMGIRAFIRRFRLERFEKISGRIAAFLMLIEPQVGFVIWEAARRSAAEPANRRNAVQRV